MPGDTVHAVQGIDELNRRARSLSDSAIRLTTLRDRLAADLSVRRDEVERLTTRSVLLGKVTELFRSLMDSLVTGQIRAIDAVITEGLQTIFYDQALAFESEVLVKYSKIFIEFYMRRGTGDLSHRGHPMAAFGGGPASIAALLLRIIVLLRLKRHPVLFLDETLSAVSDDYIDQTGRFLSRLAATMGVEVLLVTHKQGFLDHADMAYQGTEVTDGDGASRLAVREVRAKS